MDTFSKENVINNPEELLNLAAEGSERSTAVDELALLNHIALSISGTIDSKKIMDIIVDRSICFIGAQQGNITLLDESSDKNAELPVRNTCSLKELSPVKPQKPILKWIQDNKEPLRLNQLKSDSSFPNTYLGSSIDSLLSVPLMVNSGIIGVLTIYNKKDGQSFTEQDQQLLSIIASQSAQVI